VAGRAGIPGRHPHVVARGAGDGWGWWAAVVALALVLAIGPAPRARIALDLVPVAPGVEQVTLTDGTLLEADHPGAISIQALKLDPAHVRLRSAVAHDALPALERVLDMAERAHAVAAINAGFFTPKGAPAGLLVTNGRPLGPGVHPRGAVAIFDDGDRTRLAFARAQLRLAPDVFAPGGVHLVFWNPHDRDLSSWQRAQDVVGGAGLLVEGGRPVTDFGVERMSADFPTARHPRSVIGVDGGGAIWLVAVDGRRPAHSVGMTFVELQRLAAALDLRDALNLDGGGSTTLVLNGVILNRPTDLTGPRAVSDAILVLPR